MRREALALAVRCQADEDDIALFDPVRARVSSAGTVTAMLATLTTGTGAPVQRPLELGVGVPAGTGCAVRQVANAAPALVPQLTLSLEAGICCVNVADVEGLPASMNFAVRIVHP